MKAFRKWFMVFAVLSMFALLFAGCSGGGSSSNSNNGPGGGGNGPTVLNRAVSASNPVVGDWGTGVTSGETLALSFYPNGTYIIWNAGTPSGTGVEYGTYTTTPISGSTITVTVTSIKDDQGDNPADPNNANGLTEYSGQTKAIPLTILDQNTVQVIGTPFILHRAVDAGNPIVGSWGDGVTGNGTAPNSVLLIVFYPNGTYIEYGNDSNATCHPGVEYGTYSYNSATSTLTVTATVDQNGDQGLANGNGTGGSDWVKVNGDVLDVNDSEPAPIAIHSEVTSWNGSAMVPVPGLTVTARHASDVDDSNPIAQTTSGADGSYTLNIPYGSDFYLHVSGSSGGTQYSPWNTRIWRNLTQVPDMSIATGDSVSAMPLSDINAMLNSVTYDGATYSGGIGSRAWVLLDAFNNAGNKIAGVSFAGTPTITYFGYNSGTTALVSPPTQSATVADTGSMATSSAVGYNTTAVFTTVTASKSGSADQTFELPLIPGELTYKQVVY